MMRLLIIFMFMVGLLCGWAIHAELRREGVAVEMPSMGVSSLDWGRSLTGAAHFPAGGHGVASEPEHRGQGAVEGRRHARSVPSLAVPFILRFPANIKGAVHG